MNRETASTPATVVVVLDGDTNAGRRLARTLLAEGCRVVVVARHPGDAVGAMHGYPADRVMGIACDVTDPRQWIRLTARVTGRFGRIDTVVRAGDATLRASA